MADPGVGRHQHQLLDACLGDEETIKGIVVVPGQVLDRQGVDYRDRQFGKTTAFELPGQPAAGEGGKADFSERRLDGDLPRAGGAHENPIRRINDRPSGRIAQTAVVGKSPEEDVGVEKEVQVPA